MEGDSTNLVEEMAIEMDEMLQNVMPATWMGHARLAIVGKDLSDKEKHKVLKVTEQLVEEKNTPAEKTAEMVITKI